MQILIIDSDQTVKNALRQFLAGLGFSTVIDAQDFVVALQKLEQRHFTHIIFDAKNSAMPTKEFLNRVFEYDPAIVALPSSYDPSVDDVFDLLTIGARGFLVKPFNEQSIEDSIIMGTKGEPLSEAILHAKNRNEALVSLIMTSVDKLATVLRQAQLFETAKIEVPRARMALKRAAEVGRHFAKGGEEKLLETIVELCLERSNGPASKLGRARNRNKNLKLNKKSPAAEPVAKADLLDNSHVVIKQ